ncbi:MAG: adenylyl-sulfate kinase [Methylococcales bacterium]
MTKKIVVDQNIRWHEPTVTRERRHTRNKHKSFILWFTGLSGAGKSTLAHRVEEILFDELGCNTFVLDGDNVRHGLCADLGFSLEDRHENIRRIGEMSKLFMQAGVITLSAFISPFRKDRDIVRSMVEDGEFIEIYCNTSLSVCEGRDVKGLYQKARAGTVREFTGISSPYEEPKQAEIVVQTGELPLEECAKQVIDYLKQHSNI